MTATAVGSDHGGCSGIEHGGNRRRCRLRSAGSEESFDIQVTRMIRQREFLARHRRRFALLAVFGVLAFAVVTEHSGLAGDEFAADDSGAAGVSMCLAVLTAGGAAIAAVAFALGAPAPRPVRELGSTPLISAIQPNPAPPRVRAGPALLQSFRS